MRDSEVHSVILERLDGIEDDNVRQFLNKVLRHEREILDEPRAKYKDEYRSFVDDHVGDFSDDRGDI